MTGAELAPLLSQYHAALEAQIALLRHLRELSARQRDRTCGHDEPERLLEIVDERDRVMATLVSLESDIQPVRQALADGREHVRHLPAFRELVELHRQAAELVEDVVRTDEQSRLALRDAELARRSAAESLQRSESTLAAYRRVVLPGVAAATLVNRKG